MPVTAATVVRPRSLMGVEAFEIREETSESMLAMCEDDLSANRVQLEILTRRHWEETEPHKEFAPLDVFWSRYATLVANNALVMVTSRMGARIIGYCTCVYGMNLHSRKAALATMDVYFVTREMREMGVGARMFEAMENALKRRGAKVMRVQAARNRSFLRKLKYHPLEVVYAKVL